MFDIGWGELLIIGIVALIAIGPKELPAALRALGQWMGKIRRMAGEFQNQFQLAAARARRSPCFCRLARLVSGSPRGPVRLQGPCGPSARRICKWAQ